MMRKQFMSAVAIAIWIFSFQAAALVVQVDAPTVLVNDLVKNCQASYCAQTVCDAPAPGQKRVVHQHEIARAAGESGSKVNKRRFPRRVIVKRPYRMATAAELKGLVTAQLEEQLPPNVFLVSLGNIRAAKVVRDGFSLLVELDETRIVSPNVSVRVSYLSQGVAFKSVHVMCKFGFKATVLRAAGNVARGQILSATDLRVETVTAPYSRVRQQLTLDDVVGKRSTVNMTAGREIKSHYLQSVPLVERGDMITVLTRSGGVHISARGTVRQSGGLRDTVLVNIPYLNKMIHVVVTSRTTGEVIQ